MEVKLLNYFGNDEMVADTARVSYAKEAENYTCEQNSKLINYLVKHGHTSPLRHCHLRFRIKCSIYVERQIFKHIVGVSVNSISGRYVDFSDTYTKIGVWRKQSKSSKQGSEGEVDNQYQCQMIEQGIIDTCKEAYSKLISVGVSKEQARTILPLNLNTEFIWTGSLQALLHMCDLRLKPDAQFETREVVAEMLKQVKAIEGNPFESCIRASVGK